MKVMVIPVTRYRQNCSLIWCESTLQGAVIDPGGELDVIQANAAAQNVRIEKILLTHGHVDHAAATEALRQQLKIPVEGPHIEDKFWIDKLPEEAAASGFPPAAVFCPDRWLENGDQVTVGKVTLHVFHCPGHTPGHVIYFDPGVRVAFVGDVLFKGSIGRTDFERGDQETLLRSISERLWPLGDDVAFVPGHGPMSTFGEERRSNPYVGDKMF